MDELSQLQRYTYLQFADPVPSSARVGILPFSSILAISIYTNLCQESASMLRIDLPDDAESRLQQLALITGRSREFYARRAVLDYLDDLEDQYLALNRIEETDWLDVSRLDIGRDGEI